MRQSSDFSPPSQWSESPDASLVSDRESLSSSSVVFTPVALLKEGDEVGGGGGGGGGFQPLNSHNSWAEGSQEGKYCRGYARNFRKLPLESETSETSTTSSLSTPQEARHSLAVTPQSSLVSETSSFLRRHPRKLLAIPNKVPPPNMAAGRRAGLTFDTSGDQSDYVNLDAMETGSHEAGTKEFVAKEGSLQRGGKVIKGAKVTGGNSNNNPKKRIKKHVLAKFNTTPAPSESLLSPGGGSEISGAGGSGATILHSNMKRSFRYRKITLRPEKALFGESTTGDNSSDEETETDNETSSVSHSKTRANFAPVTINEEDIKKLGPNFGINPSPTATRRYETLSTSRPSKLLKTKANSYSKIMVGRRLVLETQASKLSSEQLEPALTRSLEVGRSHAPIRFAVSPPEETSSKSLVPGPVESEWDTLRLPARFPSDPYLYASMNSLDNIMVDPPVMFSTDTDKEKSKQLLELEQVEDAPKLQVVNQSCSNGGVSKGLTTSRSHDKRQLSGPSAHADVLTMSGTMVTDRNSTESCDTGYTSASPGYGNNASGYHDNKGDKPQESNEHPSQLHLKHTLPAEHNRSITPPPRSVDY